jgi:hypothetical protein
LRRATYGGRAGGRPLLPLRSETGAGPRKRTLRLLAASLAGGLGVGHLVLGVVDLIPGEATAGPIFLGIGGGYLVLGALVFLRKTLADPLAFFYALALVLAYGVSRDRLPVEPIGLAFKAIEVVLLIALAGILRENRTTSIVGPGSPSERNNSRREP